MGPLYLILPLGVAVTKDGVHLIEQVNQSTYCFSGSLFQTPLMNFCPRLKSSGVEVCPIPRLNIAGRLGHNTF